MLKRSFEAERSRTISEAYHRGGNSGDSTIATDQMLECINPATNKLITTIPVSSESEISEKLAIVKNSLEMWQGLSLTERARHITKARKHLVKRMDDVIDILCRETGKTYFDGVTEVLVSSEIMRFVARRGVRALKPERRRIGLLKTKRGYVNYLPYGVVAMISPWNYPLILSAGPAVQALMAGNGVLFKPSEYAPLTALKLKEILDESGFPMDILQVVVGAGDVGQKLVDSPDTKLVCFTGSPEVGRKVARSCASQLKPVLLELGGKDSMIVLEDADVERAARAAVWGGFNNAGQTCISVERVYVIESVASQFIERVIELARETRYGLEKEPSDIGSMITERQMEIVLTHIEEARAKGADVPVGGERDSSLGGFFLQPTVILDPGESTKIMTQETFGPEVAIIRVKDDQEALEKANALPYGLNASVFTQSMRKARQMAGRLHAGNVCINDVLSNYLCVELPFGGVGVSGTGRLQGVEGLRNFVQTQSVCEDKFGLKKEPWWFPVSDSAKKGFRALIKLRYG